MKKEILHVTFYWDGKEIQMNEEFEHFNIPRVGEKISFDTHKYPGEKTIEKIEHRYSDHPNLNHLVSIYCK